LNTDKKKDGRTKKLPKINVVVVNEPSEEAIKDMAQYLSTVAQEHLNKKDK